MYKQHFGLRDFPFGIAHDTSYWYPATYFQQALNTLLIAAENGEGCVKITGGVGTGKTFLCREFLRKLGDKFVTAYVPNPCMEPRTLLRALGGELGVALDPDADHRHLLQALHAALRGFAARGRRVIVCLDEAQAMPQESFETLRLLTNFESGQTELLQVVLFGQPDLDDILRRESGGQLEPRTGVQYRLGTLTRRELEDYIAHRLNVAGLPGKSLFTRRALNLLFAASHGVPRLVNIMAHKAMLVAYGEGKRAITASHVRFAVRDTPQAFAGVRRWWWALGVGCICSLSAGWALFR